MKHHKEPVQPVEQEHVITLTAAEAETLRAILGPLSDGDVERLTRLTEGLPLRYVEGLTYRLYMALRS